MSDLPPQIVKMSRVPRRMLMRGVPMGPLTLLRTRGRRTGNPHTMPVVTFRHGGAEWLVSPFGESAWVRNARADGHAELGRGRRFRQVLLVEVTDERRGEVLWRYRRRFAIVPFVRHAFRAEPGQGVQAFEQEAAEHPVFLVEPIEPVE
jgi:deazaflavin-dependent oxidoreductase (nitroreductase family)